MDVATIKHNVQEVGAFLKLLATNVKRLFLASPVFAVALLTVSIGVGLLSWFTWDVIGRFLDAALGARGVGTMTSEVRAMFWLLIVCVVGKIVAFGLFGRAHGLVKELGYDLALIVAGIVLGISILSPLTGGVVLLAVLFAIRIAFKQIPWLPQITSVVMLLLGLAMMHRALIFLSARALTLGDMVTMAGSAMTLAVIMAVAPFGKKFLKF